MKLLELNISDVRDDIQDASDENLLVLTTTIAENLNDAEAITVDLLFELCDQYDVTEINCVDPDVTLSAQDWQLGGLGIYIVKKSMDEITYEYKDGRNILTIKKNL